MLISDVTVEVRDKDYVRIGQIHPNDLELEAWPVYNGVGTWQLTLPDDHPMVEPLKSKGSGIAIYVRDKVFLSGRTLNNSRRSGIRDLGGTITFQGVSDDFVLAARMCYPDPTNPDPTTQTLAHDIREGTAEDLMHEFMRVNCLEGVAATGRGIAHLTEGSNLSRGPLLKKSARFDEVGVLLGELGILADLGFEVVQEGNGIVFRTFQIADRTDEIRLDVENGTLTSDQVDFTTPSVTRVLVAGQGDLVDRQFVECTSPASIAAETDYGLRIERFLDQRHTDEISELTQAGNELISEAGIPRVIVKATPTDDTTMIYGQDWGLGDRITIVVDGSEYTDVVRGALLKIGAGGLMLGVEVGGEFDGEDKRAEKVDKRLSNLERNTGNVSQQVHDNTEALVAHATSIGDHETRIGSLETFETDADIRLTAVESRGVTENNFTPFFTATTTNPGMGNSIRVGRYLKVGRLVHVYMRFDIGSTFTPGSGFYSIGLPYPVADDLPEQLLTAHLVGGGEWTGNAKIENGKINRIYVSQDGVSTTVDHDSLSEGRRLIISGTYIADTF